MINQKRVSKYCCEDISKIENYYAAVSPEAKWQLHHKNEITLNMSRIDLIKNDLYFNRPADELIFLTLEDHARIHNPVASFMRGKRAFEVPSYKWVCPILLAYLYNVKKDTMKDISKRLEISRISLYKKIDELGIQRRPDLYHCKKQLN